MREGRTKTYEPHAGQVAFHRSRQRFRSICAGRRSGKSEAAGWDFMRRVLWDQQRSELEAFGERQYWVCAPTDELTGIARRKIEAVAGACKLRLRRRENGVMVGQWPIWVRFRSTWAISQLIGEDVWGIWWDEAAKSSAEAWAYLEPTISGTAGFVITSTTPEGQNWFWEAFWRPADPTDEKFDPRFGAFHFTSAANPYLAHICPTCLQSYIAFSAPWRSGVCPADETPLLHEAVWKKARLDRRTYLREYEASFTAFAGQIWEELDQATHWAVLPAGLRFKRLVAGQDWNWAVPGAFVLLAEDIRGRWWLVDEIHAARLPVWDDAGDCWVKRIKACVGRWERELGARCEVIYCDPAAPEAIDDERRKGLPVRPADNAVQPGISTVAVLAHPIPEAGPRLVWAVQAGGRGVNAPQTWRQAITYRFEDGTERPVKEMDHGCDAVRYALHSAVGKQVGQMIMGQGRLTV